METIVTNAKIDEDYDDGVLLLLLGSYGYCISVLMFYGRHKSGFIEEVTVFSMAPTDCVDSLYIFIVPEIVLYHVGHGDTVT